MKKTLTALLLALASNILQAKLPIEHWVTSQGTKVYFISAPSVPMLDINVDFDAGERRAPSNKVGIAQLTHLMIGKNTNKLDEQGISESFADVAAQRGGQVTQDRASFSLRTLTSTNEQKQAISTFASILQQATFPEAILAREKLNLIATIKEQNTQPEVIAEHKFQALMYPQHPYGRQATVASIEGLNSKDLLEFYHEHYQPKYAVISIVGAITKAEARIIAEKIASNFTPSKTSLQKLPNVIISEKANTATIPHPASQAHILIGIPAVTRNDPSIFILTVGNYILGGGGFQSRLMNEIREKRGLVYNIQSAFNPAAQLGSFEISFQTQKQQSQEALKLTNKILKDFLENGPTQEELEAAKKYLINGFPLRIDGNKKILDYLALIGFYNLPLNYLDTWKDNIAAVTTKQIQDEFKKRIQLNQISTVVIGSEDEKH